MILLPIINAGNVMPSGPCHLCEMFKAPLASMCLALPTRRLFLKQTAKYHLVGQAPLLMHNGQLSDPLNEWTKAKKKITDKRKKTEADHEEIGRLEWMGSLYLHNGVPCLPREVIKATLLRAAMTLKKGPKVKPGLVCEAPAQLIYDGPTDPIAMWKDGRYTYRTTKSQKGQRVVRTRPMFYPWEASVLIAFSDEILSPDEVDEIVAIGGHTIGLLDERPEYGRYMVTKL